MLIGLATCAYGVYGLVAGEIYWGEDPPEWVSKVSDPVGYWISIVCILSIGIAITWMAL